MLIKAQAIQVIYVVNRAIMLSKFEGPNLNSKLNPLPCGQKG